MAIVTAEELTPRQRAAIVVMSLGSEAKPLLENLAHNEVELVAEEILRLGDVPEEMSDAVLAEFHNRIAASQAQTEGGLERAARILEESLGKTEGTEAFRKMEWRSHEALTAFVKKDPAKFAQIIIQEHPQTMAFILTQVDPEAAGQVIAALPEELQPEMGWRIATMREISPDAAATVHGKLAPLFRPAQGEGPVKRAEQMGGEELVAGLLNMVPLEAQKTVLDSMSDLDADLAARVRKLMFVFRDLLLLDDRGMQRLLKEVDQKDLCVALKKADDSIQAKFFKNMSERAALTIREEMDYMNQLKPEEIEGAQDRIIDQARALEEQGEIVIDRGGESE